MNDTITIPRDRLQEGVVQFVESSALAYCTDRTTDVYDAVQVTSSYPVAGFSSGELVAWALLRSLVNGELRRAVEKLDGDNLGALIGCLATVRGAVLA